MESPQALRWAGYFGVAAAVIYVLATAGGSLLDPTYSQVRQHVSDLTATGAITRDELSPFYLLYNASVIGFAVSLYRFSERTVLFRSATGLLVLNAFAGVMMVTWLTEDLGGAPTTFAGTGHIVFATVSSLAIVSASILFGFAFRRTPGLRSMSTFSFAIGAAFVVTAPFAIIATAANSYAGLAERAAIAPFIIWLLVLGAYAWVKSGQIADTEPKSRASVA